MKNIKVKIEKIRRLFSRAGVFNGFKVLREYSARARDKGYLNEDAKVLFVTSGTGDSAMYRAYNPAEELRLHGISAYGINADNVDILNLVDKCKIFIFHRVSYTDFIKSIIEKIKKQKKEIIFETDDLVYDPKYLSQMDYFKKMGREEQALYENGIGAEIINDPYVKVCTTTVSYLAEKLKEKNKKVFVVPNKMSQDEWDFCQNIKGKKESKDGFIRIAYASGTLSHNKDFASIKEALLSILKKYSQVKLYLMGPLDIPNEFNEFKDQVEFLSFAPRKQFLRNLNKADINLAPLELGNPFCESKSALKFSEAGALGVPTVAVKNQTFSETIIDGVDGFLAGSTAEWVEKIGRLIEDSELRRSMGERAREKILKNYTNKNSHTEDYYNYLRKIIKD